MASSQPPPAPKSLPPVSVVDDSLSGDPIERQQGSLGDTWKTLGKVLGPLASLKLTVVLLAMAIFIIVAGTFAQVDKDIWQVVDEYFRINFAEAMRTGDWLSAAFVRIDFDIFFPPAFYRGDIDLDWYIPFPKGWLIGLAMSLNLLSAHLIRFKVQARGARLAWGLVALVAGVLATLVVIQSGSNAEGVQQSIFAGSGGGGFFDLDWKTFWRLLLVGIALAFLGALYGAVMVESLPIKNRIAFGILAAAIGSLLAWLLYQGADARLGDPSLRILWQLIKATFAGGILLVGCFLLFRKRAGVVLLHGGIGLMMFSELLVGTTAQEARMSMREGQTMNYVFDIRALELAVVEPGEKEDKVAVISDAEIRSHLPQGDEQGGVISSDQLPFDLRIIKYLPNASLARARADEELIASSGLGTLVIAMPARQSTGVDTESAVDLPAAYVEVLDKQSGEPVGTFLTSVIAGRQLVQHEGKRYDIQLRFEREYLPYHVTLTKATRENYIGTSQAKDYSSDIVLKDTETDSQITHHIWMNNPLRYRNRTFYQSGFSEGDGGGATTTLQVVNNSGWMLPYVACMIVAVGLLAHFTVILVRYLQRRRREKHAEAQAQTAESSEASRAQRRREKRQVAASEDSTEQLETQPGGFGDWARGLFRGSSKEKFARWFPFGVVALCAIWILSILRPASLPTDGMDLEAFGNLPVVYEGRVKPLDTLARTSLRQLSTKQTYFNAADEREPALRWLIDLMSGRLAGQGVAADQHKIIRIDNPDVVELLGLEWVPRHLYSRQEVEAAIATPRAQVAIQALSATPTDKLTTTQQKLVDVLQARRRLDLLENAFQQPLTKESVERWTQAEIPEMVTSINRFEAQLIKDQAPFLVPVDINAGSWRPLSSAAAEAIVAQTLGVGPQPSSATAVLERILEAYRSDKPLDFNRAVASYRQLLLDEANKPNVNPAVEYDQEKHDFESFFNRIEPFYYLAVLYVLAGLMALIAWLGWSGPLNRASFWLLCFTFALHTLALIGRMYISGRPPVTNLYTTGIFISWGCVLIGLILERWSKLGLGNVIAAACGFGGLLIAHLLTTSVATFRGDTFTVMQAVLDTQFWLATHVVIINLGYAATGLAGGFGTLYIILGICTPKLSKRMDQHLVRMIYGTLCFSIFFSFIGTVLGGLWADDSWGRFWGWDPKENGALIIVLWNAIVLHARWDGMVKDRGLAVLCVLGNICVTWSWFMVNELGVGLHSYGFTEGVLAASGVVIFAHIAIASLGTFWPKARWWSVRARDRDAISA